MASTPQQTAITLQRALQNGDSRGLKGIFANLPNTLPHSDDPAQIAQCLEHVRIVADVLTDACNFNTAFEAAINARSLLIQAKMLPWAVSVLKSFAFDERIVGRMALALAHVGIGAEARGEIGKAGAVDQLAIAWKTHPTSIPIVQALISLCAGHIDNISRIMRRRGISTAIKVLRNSQSAANVLLVEQIMILVGLCTICIPDNVSEGSHLVPAILYALDCSGKRKPVAVARHALIVIANIADCWVKEQTGYELGDTERLVQLVMTSWESARTCKDMALAASWALSALYSHDTNVWKHVERRGRDFSDVVNRWKTHSKTAAFLATVFDATSGPGKHNEQLNSDDEPLITKRPQRLGGKGRLSPPTSDADGDCKDQDMTKRRAQLESLRRSTKPKKLAVITNANPRTSPRRLTARKEKIQEVRDYEADPDNWQDEADPHLDMEETSSEVQTMIVDSDSDAAPSPPPRSPAYSVPSNELEVSDQSSERKHRRNTSKSDADIASRQLSEDVVLVKPSTNDDFVYEETGVRRSKRMRTLNSKHVLSRTVFDVPSGPGQHSEQLNSDDEPLITKRPPRVGRRERRSPLTSDADGDCKDQDMTKRSLHRSTKSEELALPNASPRTSPRCLTARKEKIQEVHDSGAEPDNWQDEAGPRLYMEETSSEVQTIVVDLDSDAAPSPPPRSPACSVPLSKLEVSEQKSQRKRRRNILKSDADIASRQSSEDVVFVNPSATNDFVYEEMEVRRSKRMRKPNPKYVFNPKRAGTRRLHARRLPSTPPHPPPLVSSPSVVPRKQVFEVIDIKLK